MNERKNVYLLILIMALVVIFVGTVSVSLLYQVALEEEKARLVETAQSQAHLIEAIYHHEEAEDSPRDEAIAHTVSQIKESHENYSSFGETGEFTLAKLEENNIVFLLRHRHDDLELPEPVSVDSELAEPMRLALTGESGTVVGLDYRGEMVMAAYEPIESMGFGIVAKIDLSEVQAPFFRAIIIIFIIGCVTIILGALLFSKITNPLIQQMIVSEKRVKYLAQQTINTQENERRNISNELHNNTGQALTALKINLNMLASEVIDSLPEYKEKFQALDIYIVQAHDHLHTVTRNLRPVALDTLGLDITLQGLCEYLTETEKVTINYQAESLGILEDDVSISFYRVGEEALKNVISHAEATVVSLEIHKNEQQIEMIITDDGMGFNPDRLSNGSIGLGLIRMRERMAMINGSLEIESSKNGGTIIKAICPISE